MEFVTKREKLASGTCRHCLPVRFILSYQTSQLTTSELTGRGTEFFFIPLQIRMTVESAGKMEKMLQEPRVQQGLVDVRASDGQVGVCVGGCGLGARVASSLLRNGGRVTVETGQHTWNTHQLSQLMKTQLQRSYYSLVVKSPSFPPVGIRQLMESIAERNNVQHENANREITTQHKCSKNQIKFG